MATFNFTLIVEGPDLQADDVVDALFEAGCERDDHVLAAISAGLELRKHSSHVAADRRDDLRNLVGL